jgi:hypothetical protein
MSNHTPGPWVEETREYHGEQTDAPTGWIKGAGGVSVVEYSGCGSHEAYWPNPADIALVLAAPDLLEALNLVVMSIKVGPPEYDINDTLEIASEAIAKATGGQA